MDLFSTVHNRFINIGAIDFKTMDAFVEFEIFELWNAPQTKLTDTRILILMKLNVDYEFYSAQKDVDHDK